MKVLTTFTLNKKDKELGTVYGSYVSSRFFVKDFLAGVRKMFGLEIKEYSEMIDEAREQAIQRMVVKAQDLGATKIIGLRFTSADVGSEVAEITAYGTAVEELK